MDVTDQDLKSSKIVSMNYAGAQERFVTVSGGASDELSVFDDFPPDSEDVVAQLVFGGCGFEPAARARMAGAPWPMLWAQGDVCPENGLSGTQALTLRGRAIRRVVLDNHVIGSAWSDADADYCLLAGVLPANFTETRGAQTTSCLRQIETALRSAGMDFSHVVRTWLYLDQLLTWYDEFNAARTEFFEDKGVFGRLIPASTGIGAANPAGAALVAGALAVRPRHGGVRIQEVQSPLQCAATDYRSSFSRAVEMSFPDHRTLMISGTASIAPDGKSMFSEDVAKQIHLTLDVVEAILQSRGMDWRNTTRAVGYFRNIQDIPIFDDCCRQRGIEPLPMLPAHAIVCRDDLLFEIELDAVSEIGLAQRKEL